MIDEGSTSWNAAHTMPVWRDSRGKRVSVALTRPVFLLLNRPSLQWFARAVYDFALRCNGIAINYKGTYGLTTGEERFAAALLARRAGCTVLDVGANEGAYTAYLERLAPAARIFAFEPHPRTFAVLRQRTGASPNVLSINMAVSDRAGRMTLYDFAGDDGSTQASLDRDAVGLFSNRIVEHDVSVTTIDDFMAERAIDRIDLLKIDTEGFDIAVLRGARAALAARTIAAIQFEFIPANIARRVTMRDFFDVLAGYRIHRLCMNGSLIPLAPYDVKRCEIYVTHNLVALPEPSPAR